MQLFWGFILKCVWCWEKDVGVVYGTYRNIISFVIDVRAREFILKVQNWREISTTGHQSTACPVNKRQFTDRNPKEKNRNALLIVFVVWCVVVRLTTFSGFLTLLCVVVWQIWLWVYRAHFDIMSKCCLLGKCSFLECLKVRPTHNDML